MMAWLNGNGAGAYSAGEAVAPNAMSPQEWSAIPGAQGGQVTAGGQFDWMKALRGGVQGLAGSPPPQPFPMTQMSGGGAASTHADPITFNTVMELLSMLQGGAKKKGAR